MAVKEIDLVTENNTPVKPLNEAEIANNIQNRSNGRTKRKRPTLVCCQCKKKKIKCDREAPCGQCRKAGSGEQCTFEFPSKENGKMKTAKLPYVDSAKNPLDFNTKTAQRKNRSQNSKNERESSSEVVVDTDELSELKNRLSLVENMLRSFEGKTQTMAEKATLPVDSMTSSSFGSASTYRDTETLNSDYHSPEKGNFYDLSISHENVYSNVNFIGLNPYDDEQETIDFYEGYTSVHELSPIFKINFGPLAWASLMRKDPASSLLYDFIAKIKAGMSNAVVFSSSNQEITVESTRVIASTNDNTEKQFERRALKTNGYDDVVPYNDLMKERKARTLERYDLDIKNIPLGFTLFDQKVDEEMRLIDKIRIVLPNRRATWKYFHRFFEWVYPFMPFTDYAFCEEKVLQLIGPKSNSCEPISKINVENRVDCAIAGLLLVMLRLTYISLLRNNNELNERNIRTTDTSEEAQEVKFLLSNPININAIEVAQECLDQFKIWRKPNFISLQLMLFLNLYNIYAPEEGNEADGGSFPFVNAMLMQTAISLGLNREPTKFQDRTRNIKMEHLGRKIWHFLVNSDVYQAYTIGSPLLFRNDIYDTKLPFIEEGNNNIEDKYLDNLVTENYFSCCGVMDKSREVLEKILNVQKKTKISELSKLISEVEVIFNTLTGVSESDLDSRLDKERALLLMKNMECKLWISLSSFLISIYHHLYLFYEKKNSPLAYFYLKKILLSIGKIAPEYHRVNGSKEGLCEFIANPSLVSFIHKSNQLFIALILRLNFFIHRMTQQEDHLSKLENDRMYNQHFLASCTLSRHLVKIAEETISLLSKLSNRYYYAWRVTKGHTYILKLITSESFYKIDHSGYNGLVVSRYTLPQIEDFTLLCKSILQTLQPGSNVPNLVPQNDDFIRPLYTIAREKGSTPSSHTDSIRSFVTDVSAVSTKGQYDSDIDKLWVQTMLSRNGNTEYDTSFPFPQQNTNTLERDGLAYGQPNNANFPQNPDTPLFNYNLEDSIYSIFDEPPIKDLFSL